MKVCFPVNIDEGLQSEIFGHFSSAPLFLVVDSESKEITAIENCDPKEPLKGCNPFAALQDKGIETIVVDGIGDAALQTMNLYGFRIFGTNTNILGQALEQFETGQLQEMLPFYSQYEGRCGGDTEEEEGCDHHQHEEEDREEGCVLNGGGGCSGHGEGSCTQH
jgi:predicted Fe-Mo cluster-binding NifX family protein